MPFIRLSNHVYLVGGKTLSHVFDCNVYLIDGRPKECVLVDSGTGLETGKILKNIEEAGFDLGQVSAVVNTHCHYCHAGGNFQLNKRLGYVEIIIHELDAPAVEKGDAKLTGASLYAGEFEPCEVNVRVYTSDTNAMKLLGFGDRLWISAGSFELATVHLPGHTPGSMGMYGKIDEVQMLFAGDINGPFQKEWGSNVEDWRASVQHLLKLEIDRMYLGHEMVNEKPKEWLKSLFRRRT